jgi:polysaccharide deacetylase family protein (PEP-CTERM system associated)
MTPTLPPTETRRAPPIDDARVAARGASGVSGQSGFHTEALALSQPGDPRLPRHAFTVDVEDWYQSCIDYDAKISERVLANVDRILELLDASGVKGSFFVQGRVAEAFPQLVSTLVALGHEVQSHGYSHRPLFTMGRRALRQELERAKQTVEDAAGKSVTAFRAQDFSVVASNLWALETLHEVGFEVDSSIFPMQRPNYGINGWPLAPHEIVLPNGGRMLEVPVAVWSRGRFRLPVAGGGYFRVLPRKVIERGLREIESAGRPSIIYCHPYEFNAMELAEYKGVSRRILISQGLGRRWFPARIQALFSAFSFGGFSDVLRAWGVPCESPS